MDLQSLPNELLLNETHAACLDEKSATLKLLHYLVEVSRRRLFVNCGHSSLLKFMMVELGYSEFESWIRIKSMRLMQKSKVVEEKLGNGSLSMTAASIIERYAGLADMSIDEAVEFSKGKSTRELKEELLKKSGNAFFEKKIILNERILEKMDKVRLSQESEIEIIEALLDEKIRNMSKANVVETVSTTSAPSNQQPSKKQPISLGVSRYIPKGVKEALFNQANHQCQFTDAKGIRCSERRFLNIDHIVPFSRGGGRSIHNLQVLCFQHNQWKSTK